MATEEWTDESGRRVVRSDPPEPTAHELYRKRFELHALFPNETVRRADEIVDAVIERGDDPAACLVFLAGELQREEVDDQLELAIAVVALQRLAARYVRDAR